jgi:hypothetical protein
MNALDLAIGVFARHRGARLAGRSEALLQEVRELVERDEVHPVVQVTGQPNRRPDGSEEGIDENTLIRISSPANARRV